MPSSLTMKLPRTSGVLLSSASIRSMCETFPRFVSDHHIARRTRAPHLLLCDPRCPIARVEQLQHRSNEHVKLRSDLREGELRVEEQEQRKR
jgi:hypothetical protein